MFNTSKISIIYKKNAVIRAVLLIIISELLLFPVPSYAGNTKSEALVTSKNETNSEVIIAPKPEKTKEISASRKVVSAKKYTMTAYSSDVAQCDSSPCITANGFNVCEHGLEDTVAANFLPFGTNIRIPELFGDKIFIVRDRMNKRYTQRVDVWFLSKDNAIDFGVKHAVIEVLE